MGVIYLISNSVNDKLYVGQTARELRVRWREHLHDCEFEDNRLYRAMRKYGKENFRIKAIEECDNELLNEREVYWVSEKDSYHNGYNATMGGDGVHMDCYSHKFVPVIQFDKHGNKLAEYESAMLAEEKTGISRAAICCVCKGVYKSVRGFQWRYKEDASDVSVVSTDTRPAANYKVVQFSLDGKRLKTFNSIREAARECDGRSCTSIRRCLSGERKTAFGYQWRYANSVVKVDAIEPTRYTGKGGRPCKQIAVNN